MDAQRASRWAVGVESVWASLSLLPPLGAESGQRSGKMFACAHAARKHPENTPFTPSTPLTARERKPLDTHTPFLPEVGPDAVTAVTHCAPTPNTHESAETL